jgi:glycosyltransferase involved in cell wall biosynthesis
MPRSVLLDVTRLVSRVGGGPATGIDRVERAMLRGLLNRDVDLFGLCRTADGFALLERSGLRSLARQLDGEAPWGPCDLVGHLSLRIPGQRCAAESDVRRLSSGRARAAGLGALLGSRLPDGTAYLNVGHGNLTDTVFRAVRSVPSSRTAVLIHDAIPLRLPWTQRAGASGRFRERLSAVASHADVVFCPSEAEREHVAAALRECGGAPPIVVAPLGVDPQIPDPGPPGSDGWPTGAYFAAVGTLEPRKSLSLLLDVWEHLAGILSAEELPGLAIIGRRGWESDDFFRRLDGLNSRIPAIREFSNASDGARTALVSGARALLFPSIAEGYGLPPLEALSVGVTPVCAPLPVYRETMGDAAVYADADDMYQWAGVVTYLTRGDARAKPEWAPPSWDDHVNKVLTTIA